MGRGLVLTHARLALRGACAACPHPSSHRTACAARSSHPVLTSSAVLVRQSGGSKKTTTSSGADARKISCEDIQLVQNLVERCLQLYMNQPEVIHTLQFQAKVEPGFTKLVWQKLEEQNPEFFKAYHTRLRVKDQIILFNHLLDQKVTE